MLNAGQELRSLGERQISGPQKHTGQTLHLPQKVQKHHCVLVRCYNIDSDTYTNKQAKGFRWEPSLWQRISYFQVPKKYMPQENC